jgi:hypothetical protein
MNDASRRKPQPYPYRLQLQLPKIKRGVAQHPTKQYVYPSGQKSRID